MSMNFSFSLLPIPVSMRTRPSSCSIRRQRKASGMRFLSSGGARRAQSALGTMPNMAPPSGGWRPPSGAWRRRRATLKVVEVKECGGSVPLREPNELSQTFRRRDRIRGRAVAALDFDAEVVAHRIEVAAWQVRQELARESHGTHARTLEQQPRGALDFSRDECPVEAGVVGHEHGAFESPDEVVHNGFERRRVPHQARIDSGESGDELRNRN